MLKDKGIIFYMNYLEPQAVKMRLNTLIKTEMTQILTIRDSSLE
ncbi:hypothetical protein ACFLRY_03910 [Bacteroidota bacterium]